MVQIIAGDGVQPHMQQVEARWANINAAWDERFGQKMEAINERIDGEQRRALINQALRSRRATQKVHWLRQEVNAVNAAVKPYAACTKGCDHCCRIGVMVAESEARVIAKEIGRPLAEPVPNRVISVESLLQDRRNDGDQVLSDATQRMANLHFGVPCPFLKNGACSIYEFRPLACRQLLNLDDDNFLCQLVEGQSVKVPYLNMQDSQQFQALVWGPRARFADLRDWFAESSSST